MEKSKADMTKPGSVPSDKYVLPIYSTVGGGGALADKTPKPKVEEAGIGSRMQSDAAQRNMELTRKDVRGAGDVSLRQMLRIDDRVDSDPRARAYGTGEREQLEAPEGGDLWGVEARVRDKRYRGADA